MLLGKVTGTVVATRKDPNLGGFRLLLVEELDRSLAGTGRFVVAVDAVSAGAGEVVLYTSGSSARLTQMTQDKPVDAVIVAIVDEVSEDGGVLYSKSGSSDRRDPSSAGTRP